MKKVLGTIGVVVAIALLTGVVSSAADDTATITLLNPPPNDLQELNVGETVTFEINIRSDEPFILAMAMPDIYYPGRAVIFRGNDIVHHERSARLQLTMTGKASSADFAAVCDWPEPDQCWDEGTVPVSIVVGVRYRAGEVVMERFDFAVKVPRD